MKPLSKSDNGNSIIRAEDYFTKLTEMYQLHYYIGVDTVADIVRGLISYGCPNEIHLDIERQFAVQCFRLLKPTNQQITNNFIITKHRWFYRETNRKWKIILSKFLRKNWKD